MLLAVLVACLQTGGPGDRAYQALAARDYDRAVTLFRAAIREEPARASLHKDLAYAYLKIGETEAARDEFAEAVRLDSADVHAALEYAFLCHETKRQAEARRVFDRIRHGPDGAARATAERAFQKIDEPLAEGIARWSGVVRAAPENFSAHHELAHLAEQRDEHDLAAQHYFAAWQLKPVMRELLVDLGRVWLAAGRIEDGYAALLAASRGSSPRAADSARQLLPARYPWVLEFRRALSLDPKNAELRRELGYLFLAMGRQSEGEQEFRRVLEVAPADRLANAQLGLLLLARGERTAGAALVERALDVDDKLAARLRQALASSARPAKPEPALEPAAAEDLGDRSYRTGMLRDALKYFTLAHERDPLDFPVMLKLGYTYNLLHDDRRAISWFRLARESNESATAAEARRAWKNLRSGVARIRTTVWIFPIWSSRWRDLFSYAQIKAEGGGRWPVRPYVSLRFIGDTRRIAGRATPEGPPQYLSESAVIPGIGVATRTWHGVMAWAEAGESIRYLERRPKLVPDYRGGVAFGRAAGAQLGGEASGWFAGINTDGVFLSRFGNEFILYTQARAGYTLPRIGPLAGQLLANANGTADSKRQYWASFVETGPGVRFRFARLPLTFSVDLLRGAYIRNGGNLRRPNYLDTRVGVWFAWTR